MRVSVSPGAADLAVGWAGASASVARVRVLGDARFKILLIEMLATAGSYMIQEFLRFDVEALHEPETQVSEPSGLDL